MSIGFDNNGLHSSDSVVEKYVQGLLIGLDVGSTTVKAVVMDPETNEILWKGL